MDRVNRLYVLVVATAIATATLSGCDAAPVASPAVPTGEAAESRPLVLTGQLYDHVTISDISGVIRLVNGCVGLLLGDGTEALVLWPPGFGLSQDGKTIGGPGGWLDVGEHLTSSAGRVRQADDVDGSRASPIGGYGRCQTGSLPVITFDKLERLWMSQ